MVYIATIKNMLLGKKPLASQAQSSEEHVMFKRRRSKWEKSTKLLTYLWNLSFIGRSGETMKCSVPRT